MGLLRGRRIHGGGVQCTFVQLPRQGQQAQALAEGVAVTDEASAMEWSGQSPRLIEGRADNLKVTRPEDLHYLQSIWPQGR